MPLKIISHLPLLSSLSYTFLHLFEGTCYTTHNWLAATLWSKRYRNSLYLLIFAKLFEAFEIT